jgi:hypothetical protein
MFLAVVFLSHAAFHSSVPGAFGFGVSLRPVVNRAHALTPLLQCSTPPSAEFKIAVLTV